MLTSVTILPSFGNYYVESTSRKKLPHVTIHSKKKQGTGVTGVSENR